MITKSTNKKPNIEMIILELLSDNDDGIRLINEYWEGIKLATKLVETEAIMIKIKAKFVTSKLSSFPIISFGLVKIAFKLSGSCFKKISAPVTINKAKNENIIKFNSKLKFPFLSSLSFFTKREKSPKLKIIIEKKAKTVPATTVRGTKLLVSKKFP